MSALTILLFNGLHYPVDAIDRAVQWSKLANSSLYALFVVGGKDRKDDYLFPNDLAETGSAGFKDEARTEDRSIITSVMALVKHQASYAKIEVHTRILTDPEVDELHAFFQKANHIIVSNKPEAPLLAINSHRIDKALEGLTAEVERIG